MIYSHYSVMLNESIESMNIKPNGIYADLTLGGGGHTREIAKKLNADGKIIAVDRDKDAIDYARESLKEFGDRIIYVHDNYKNIDEIIVREGFNKLDGAIADLGVSSWQIDMEERGFSYMKNARLDMRMDKTQSLSAFEVVNNYSKEKLKEILYNYGEERFAEIIVRGIIKRREEREIINTGELADIIKYAINGNGRNIKYTGGHPAKRTFQAIRMEVNGELEHIEPAVNAIVNLLNKGGRFAAISFHSGEDRIIKHIFAGFEKGCVCPVDFPVCVCGKLPVVKVVNKKPILPSEHEIEENQRSSSAKLRVLEKL